MTKQDIIDKLTYECGLKHSSAIVAVNGVFEAITEALKQGDNVYIRNFATFKVVDVPERPARNIQTGEQIVVPPCRKVKLIMSKELKTEMNKQPADESIH